MSARLFLSLKCNSVASTPDLAAFDIPSGFIAPILSMTRWNHHPSTTLVAFFLACSLLIAQWAGLQHRVAHAQLQTTGIVTAEVDRSANEAPDNHLFHSCVLLDASAMGASLPTGEFVPRLLSNTSLPITVLPLVSWQALFTRQFSSRAPPFFS